MTETILSASPDLDLSALRERDVKAPPAAPPLSREELVSIAAAQLNQTVTLAAGQFKLSARRPHDPAGLMDFYRPGRWDSTSDLVYMSSIVTGSSPGMWEGTVGYVNYKAAAAGTYLVAVHFSGHQITMKASGPWGNVTAFNATTAMNSTVMALWNAAANATLYFSFSCTSPGNLAGVGFLRSVRVQPLS